jgi:hypothetical protein
VGRSCCNVKRIGLHKWSLITTVKSFTVLAHGLSLEEQALFVAEGRAKWLCDTQYNGIQHNDTQDNVFCDTQYNNNL